MQFRSGHIKGGLGELGEYWPLGLCPDWDARMLREVVRELQMVCERLRKLKEIQRSCLSFRDKPI